MSRLTVLLDNTRQALIALDQTANALLGVALALLRCLRLWPRPVGRWWADETISAHCWRWRKDGTRSWPCKLIDGLALIFGDKDHCRESYESERLGRQLPPELRPSGGGHHPPD